MADVTGMSREQILAARVIWAKAWEDGYDAALAISPTSEKRKEMKLDAAQFAKEEYPLPRVRRRGLLPSGHIQATTAGDGPKLGVVTGGIFPSGPFTREDLDAMKGLLDDPWEPDE